MSHLFFINQSLIRQLDLLQATLARIESHALKHGMAPGDWLDASLAADMLPLKTQVQIATNLALRTAFPLASRPIPAFARCDHSAAGLHTYIAQTLVQLKTFTDQDFADPPTRITAQAGDAPLDLTLDAFIHHFALPNFHFHCAMVHAIARQLGVRLSKGDFDGLHAYLDSQAMPS